MVRRCIVILVAVWLLADEAAASEQPAAEDPLAQLARRIQVVENEPGVKAVASRALEQARLALTRARALRAAGRHDAAHRATSIGLAAVLLASRQSARQRELAELRFSARRAASAQVEASLARDALQAARARSAATESGAAP